MAKRRAFSMEVVNTDKFLDMPLTTQALYFHMGMRADDDGFISSPKQITRLIGCSDDDLRILAMKGFIIPFHSGVIVLTHWKKHNSIKNDRYKATMHKSEYQQLSMVNNTYSLDNVHNGDILETERRQVGDKMETEWRQSGDTSQKQTAATGQTATENHAKECTPGKKDIDAFFEQVWSLYPSKKGKGRVSDTQKRKLFKVGLDELARAVERYKEGLEKDSWRKPQNGSTFFNSGYIDYLDENYVQQDAGKAQEDNTNMPVTDEDRQWLEKRRLEHEERLKLIEQGIITEETEGGIIWGG